MRAATQEQEELRMTCRDYLTRQDTSLRNHWTAEEVVARYQDLVSMGWPALAVPEVHGGLGLSLPAVSTVCEELGRSLDPTPLISVLATTMSLIRDGSPACLEAVLPGIAAGQILCTSTLTSLPDGDLPIINAEQRTVTGQSQFVPNLSTATHVLAAAHDGDDITVCLVALDQAGVTRTMQNTADPNRHDGAVTFEATPLMPEVSVGRGAAARFFDLEVALRCAELVGIGRRALELSVAYSLERRQFGRPIGANQALQHRMADTLVDLEGASASTAQAVEALVDAASSACLDVSVAKAWVGPTVTKAASDAIQIHGGTGFSWEYGLHHMVRRTKLSELLWGSRRWHLARVWAAVGTHQT